MKQIQKKRYTENKVAGKEKGKELDCFKEAHANEEYGSLTAVGVCLM